MYMAVQNFTALLVDCVDISYGWFAECYKYCRVSFSFAQTTAWLKNGYQQSLLSVDDFAGNMDVMTN